MAKRYTIHELYDRFLLGQIDAEGLQELIGLFATADIVILEELVRQKLADERAVGPEHPDQPERYNRILMNLRAKIAHAPEPKKWYWLRIAAAAATVTLIAGLSSYWFISSQQVMQEKPVVKTKVEVKPGGNKAFLTLSNGKSISLATVPAGVIAEDAGDHIRKVVEGQITYVAGSDRHTNPGFNVLRTPNGGQYRVNLPDGTRVWLNAASSLKYPVNFKNLKERKIELTGEAYFEVSRDPKHPFIVQTDDQRIRVLGTRFNVNAYHDEGGSKTTLVEGSIKATSVNAAATIRPGHEVTTNGPGRLKVDVADIELALAWKNDQFMFESEPLRRLMKRLARWYDVDVVYGNDIPEIRFNGAISRFENISSVLKIVESTGKAHFKIVGRTLYVER